MPDPREWAEEDEETSDARQTPGDPALAGQERAEIDRYVEWQHDADAEYLKAGR